MAKGSAAQTLLVKPSTSRDVANNLTPQFPHLQFEGREKWNEFGKYWENQLTVMPRPGVMRPANGAGSACGLMLAVVCPPDKMAGHQMVVQGPDGTPFNVTVPPGVQTGATFQVQVPVPVPMQTFHVQIPSGLQPGQQFIADVNGKQMQVVVPHGSAPGSMIQIQAPTSA